MRNERVGLALKHGTFGSGKKSQVQSAIPVLLIEDDELIKNMLFDELTGAGYEPTLETTGEDALSLLDRDHAANNTVTEFRALVTDINLGGTMDGWQVAQRAREIDPTFPVIYMTGAAAAEWPSKGVPNSILLSKPFAPAQLITAISNLLNAAQPLGQKP